ncbi:Methyltransferase type 11 [Penicillium manginii]|uniref:Methyltransferase type 11 n=1 Tax=Penicillium manginii TaxID=203109 RepID=UPI0025493A6A|nr:Methyltransferase type 11 [Penicillium manginii]KAJ5739657.1 Methyltransferase type 11 [Penicillium manginii]
MSDPTVIKENIRKAYNEIADTYLEWTTRSHPVRLSHLNALLKAMDFESDSTPTPGPDSNSINILELGCGAGVPCTQVLAARANTTVTANDISDTQIALAKTRLPANTTLIQGDMMALSFEDGSFDAVIAMYSIIHLPRTEQTELLRRIGRWLKVGGRFLGNFSEAGFEGSVKRDWLGGSEGEMYWSGWGREEIGRILREEGFQIEVDEVVVDVEVDCDGGVGRDVPFNWIRARKI